MNQNITPQGYGLYSPMIIQYDNLPQYNYTLPKFGVPMSYGYVQYNLQNQYQKLQNPRINYTYPNTNVVINNNNNNHY